MSFVPQVLDPDKFNEDYFAPANHLKSFTIKGIIVLVFHVFANTYEN